MNQLKIFFFFFLLIFFHCSSQKSADILLLNGKIVTLDEARPEVSALAIRDGKILALGSDSELQAFQGSNTQVIDLQGHLAIPGFIESHGHFLSLGQSKLQLDLRSAQSWEEIVTQVQAAARQSEPGEWITGRGWHQEKWSRVPEPNVEGLPFHDALSQVTPENPVLLTHASGHSLIANARAVALAGIDRNTVAPDGGEIVRDARGEPIGVFRETAMGLVRSAYQAFLDQRTSAQMTEDRHKAIRLAEQTCLAHGITSFHDAGASFELIDLYRHLAESDELGVRLWVMIGAENEHLAEKLAHYKIINAGDFRLTVRAIKRYIDGALGAHGAWLLAPYDDLPGSTGLNTTALESLAETAELALQQDFQLCTHAIGDRANHEILDIYERAFQNHPDKHDLRWRIEHAQHLHPDDIPRFAALGVTAAMQGIHCTSDGPWVPKRLGLERARTGAYVWKSLLDTGALISNGTDTPVESVDPIACFYATVTRRLADGGQFFPEQCLSRMEALRTYTLNGAMAACEENIKGSLSPGKLADITVLSKDILTIPEAEILTTRVLYTIVGGRIGYRAQVNGEL